MSKPAHDRVLIVDFGSQVTQLIARRLRESGVYCEIHPYDKVGPMLAGPHMAEAFKAKQEGREPVFPDLVPVHRGM